MKHDCNNNFRSIIREMFVEQLQLFSLKKTLSKYYETNSYGQKGDRTTITIPKIENSKLNWLFFQLLDIIDELLINHIESDDFTNPEHWGFKPDGVLGLYDIGFGNYYAQFKNDLEDIPIELGEDYISQILRKLNIKSADLIGGGMNGSAYEIGDNKILKITRDRSEAVNCQKIIGKKLKHLADIYTVKQFKIDGRINYVILLEKLRNENKITQLAKELSDVFDKQRNKHLDISILNAIKKKHPIVADFILDMNQNGYEKTWDKWRNKLVDEKLITQYDWNDISEISQWVKGSIENKNDIMDEPPHYVIDLIKFLIL